MRMIRSNCTISFQPALQADRDFERAPNARDQGASRADLTFSDVELGKISSAWLGLFDYSAALETQKKYWNSVYDQSAGDTVLGLEHPAVITLGSRGESAQDLLGGALPCVVTDRGGQATLHSEGQLVIYPVVDLRRRGLGVREFVEILQTTTEQLLLEFGIQSKPAAGAGLETETGKIAFIGLRVERGITRHGLSLNVVNDLCLFAQIRSCGVSAARLDRMANHPGFARTQPDLKAIFDTWTQFFERNLALESV